MDSCFCNSDEKKVQAVLDQLPAFDSLKGLADFFKVFGDPTRLKILYALSMNELCVCDLSAILSAQQSTVSHQLRLLKEKRLVKYRRDGKNIYYSLNDTHINQIIEVGLTHINE
jgi:ArsR family transcriptional regulator